MEQSLDSVKVAFSFTANYASNIYTWDQNVWSGWPVNEVKRLCRDFLIEISGRNARGRVATLISFSILYSYDMKSL